MQGFKTDDTGQKDLKNLQKLQNSLVQPESLFVIHPGRIILEISKVENCCVVRALFFSVAFIPCILFTTKG